MQLTSTCYCRCACLPTINIAWVHIKSHQKVSTLKQKLLQAKSMVHYDNQHNVFISEAQNHWTVHLEIFIQDGELGLLSLGWRCHVMVC